MFFFSFGDKCVLVLFYFCARHYYHSDTSKYSESTPAECIKTKNSSPNLKNENEKEKVIINLQVYNSDGIAVIDDAVGKQTKNN